MIEKAQGILGWVTEELRDLDGVWKSPGMDDYETRGRKLYRGAGV